MALKALMLRRSIDLKAAEISALEEKDAEFAARESELTRSIEEVETAEQRAAVEDEVARFDSERQAHEQAKAALGADIDRLRAELAELEANDPPAAPKAAEPKNERTVNAMPNPINIRTLPRSQRAFDTLPLAQRQQIVAQPDVQEFFAQLRDASRVKAAVTGAELTIPVVFLDLIAENMYRYSKLMNRVRVRNLTGEARQTIGGTVPEAVWTECCGALNELSFVFNQITADCYKVGGFVLICNSLLQDSDLDLAGELIEMISESIGMAKDKAILYGTGIKMPLGIVTRLAQQSQPADYPASAPAWSDLHTSNIKSIDGSLTGAAFWAALTLAAGSTVTRYSRGDQFWAMNSRTYNQLKSKAITFTASGDVVANVFNTLPIINGNIDILEFMPDGDIVGGYGDLYLWAQRRGMELGTDMNGFTLRVKDNTLFWGKERADGQPIIAGAFAAINIAGSSVTTSVSFAGDIANDATLESLTVGALSLSPSFDPATGTYTASAANGVSSAAVTATPAQAGAEVTITVTTGTTAKKVVNGGSAALAVGDNVITVTVTKGNATRVYTVTVTRAAS